MFVFKESEPLTYQLNKGIFRGVEDNEIHEMYIKPFKRDCNSRITEARERLIELMETLCMRTNAFQCLDKQQTSKGNSHIGI